MNTTLLPTLTTSWNARLSDAGRAGMKPLRYVATGLFVMLLLMLSLLLTSQTASAYTVQADTLWHEDWEDPQWFLNWTVDNGTWEVGTPTSGPDSAYAGNNLAATVLDGNYAEPVDTRLIRSASFVVPPASENPRLRFWHWFSFSAGDNGEVQISTDGGATWTTVLGPIIGTGSNVWSVTNVDLSAYAGQTIQLAFDFHSQQSGPFGNISTGWYIDEVLVESGLLFFNNPEDFEAGVGDWWVESGTWEIDEATSGPGSCFESTGCAGTVLEGNYSEPVDTRLVSPPFIVPDAKEEPILIFWHWFSFAAGDNGEFQISADRGMTWDTRKGPFSGTSAGIWSPVSDSLADYAGQTIQVAFDLHSEQSGPFGNVSSGWYIDSLTIFCGDSPCSDVVIPVELATFDARVSGREVLLTWQTLSETNNAGFTVQRKTSREDFEQIGFVEGAGTTNEAQTYRFTDSALPLGAERLTYRLKQVDFDGAFEYSPEVDVLIGAPEAFALHGNVPNPFGERTRLRYELPQGGDVRLTVYNVLGQRVATLVDEHQEAGRKEVVFDASALASGVYMLRLEARGRVQTRKVMVVR